MFEHDLVKHVLRMRPHIRQRLVPVGEGVFEMREDFGPGWRMYYVQRGAVIVVMLGGGDKSTQDKDIDAAKALSRTLED